MSQTLKQSIDEYRRQFKADAASADKCLLEDIRASLAHQLQVDVLDSEVVHAAVDLSNHFGVDREVTVQTLSRYLTQSLPDDEEAWARWRLVDHLAMLQECAETVTTQQQFLQWARHALTLDQLLWVMYDSTQALCWVESQKGDEWLQIFHSLMAQVPATPENRRNRLIYLETASMVLNKLNRPSEALQIARMVQELSEEDDTWDRALEARLESLKIIITVHSALNEIEELRRIAIKATGVLEEEWQNLATMTRPQRQRLLVMYHNLGGTLYLAGQHDLAIPTLRRAVELHSFVEHTYLWLSASLWATTKNRAAVLAILKQGAQMATGNRGLGSLGYDKWMILPEFADVVNDSDFLDAVM